MIASTSEELPGQPLLVPVMRGGRRVASEALDVIRVRALAQLEALPPSLLELTGSDAYPVSLSEGLTAASAKPRVDG